MKTFRDLLPRLICITEIPVDQNWNAVAHLNSSVANFLAVDNEIHGTGAFTPAGGDPDADDLERWDGNAWQVAAPKVPANNLDIVTNAVTLIPEAFTTESIESDDRTLVLWPPPASILIRNNNH